MADSKELSPELSKAQSAAKTAQQTTTPDPASQKAAVGYLDNEKPKEYSSAYIKLLKEFPEYILDRNISIWKKLISLAIVVTLVMGAYLVLGARGTTINVYGDAHFYGTAYGVSESRADSGNVTSDAQETTDESMPSEAEQTPVPEPVEVNDSPEADSPSDNIPQAQN